jgi:hypothetical protein
MDDADKIREMIQANYDLWLKHSRLQDIQVDDDGNLNWTALNERLVTYDETSEAQAKTKVEISGGILRRSATHDSNPGEAVDTSNSVTQHAGIGLEIFVMSSQGDLHMASHKFGKYHHSSLLAGISVAGAGTIQASGGQIMVLNDKSGHYMPTVQQTRQVCHMLKKKGVDLSKVHLELAFSIQKFNGPADQFFTEGEENSLEKDMTQKTVKFFIETRGKSRVMDAFKKLGWVLSEEKGEFVVRRGDHAEANPQEVRDVLHGHFTKVEKSNDKMGNRENGDAARSDKNSSGIYLNEDNGQHINQDNRKESGGYFAQDNRSESGSYFAQDNRNERGGYFVQDNRSDSGGYFAQDNRSESAPYFAQDNRKESGGYFAQDNRERRSRKRSGK